MHEKINLVSNKTPLGQHKHLICASYFNTFRSLRQLELSATNSTRKAHPIRAIVGDGISVIASAGFG